MMPRTALVALLSALLLPVVSHLGPRDDDATARSAAAVGPGVGDRAVDTAARPAADTTVVTMTNRLTFEKDTVRIAVGETVVWRNTSDLVHTVTADPDRAAKESNVKLPTGVDPFHSGRVPPGTTFARIFREPGTYGYFCVPHEGAGMTGVVEVTGP